MANERDIGTAKIRDQIEEAPPGIDMIGDCRLMLRFSLKEALTIPDELRREISQLDLLLTSISQRPISNVPIALLGREAATSQGSRGGSDRSSDATELGAEALEVLMKVHQGLSAVVAPANALSLQASEPSAGRRHFLGGTPPLVQLASLVALLCAIVFALSAADIAKKTEANSAGKKNKAAALKQPDTAANAPSVRPRSEETPAP